MCTQYKRFDHVINFTIHINPKIAIKREKTVQSNTQHNTAKHIRTKKLSIKSDKRTRKRPLYQQRVREAESKAHQRKKNHRNIKRKRLQK